MSSICKKPDTASPGRPGQLKFKCSIWPNCPMYERLRQDQSFIFSPETLQFAPQTLRNTLLSIPGLDGAFLRPIPNFYIDNFLAFLKPDAKEKVEKNSKKAAMSRSSAQEGNDYNWKKGTYSLDSFEFLALDKDLTSNLLVLEGNSAIFSNSIASHQTWIADGSLYCDVNLMPSEYNSISKITSNVIRTIKSYCPQWKYVSYQAGQSFGIQSNSESISTTVPKTKNTVAMPSMVGIAQTSDPAAVIAKENIKSFFSLGGNVYTQINPGVHWRVLKRTPIFQGEDFVVEFIPGARESNAIANRSNVYKMLDKFSFLDINAVTETSICGAFDPGDFFNPTRDKSSEIVEERKKSLDLSRQIYYIIEIGVEDTEHNYWLIISENNFPFFCHCGKSPTLTCRVEADSSSQTDQPPPPKQNSPEPKKCRTDTDEETGRTDSSDVPLKEVISVEYDFKQKKLRKLSTYDAASSSTLLRQDKLKVSVRQHAGNIVVTFSGFEDRPWVISRKDIDLSSTPTNVPISESQVAYRTVQMLIPFGRIALMGGNRNCQFSFAPMLYTKLNKFVLPQPFTVQGPIDAQDVQFLWRDKGKSLDPDVAVSLQNQQYTNEAGIYREIAVKRYPTGTAADFNNATEPAGLAEKTTTYAIDVQPRAVWNYGKAPDMMKAFSGSGTRLNMESVLEIDASECVLDQGSTAARSKLFQVAITALPGSYLFPVIDNVGTGWLLNDCVTPILYYFRMFVPPKGCIFEKSPIDVSQHVLTFSDEWSETEWQELEHNGSISFLVSDGMKFRNNQSNYLYSLADKTFYLQISIWWEDGIMPTPIDPRDKVVFTGFCHGGVVTTETNKKILECKINDYSKILKDQMFFNSPFFDRMRDVNAVYDIMQMCGLRDGEDNGSTFEPGSLIRSLALSEYQGGWHAFFYNGDKIYNREYALPGSYDILQSPFLKFSDGSNYWEAIKKMSLLSNKVAYFDRLGVFHFEPLPYDQEVWGGQSGSQTNWTIQDWANLSKVDFFATPKQLATNGAEMNRQIIGDYKVERVVQDVMNEIKVLSTSPNGEVFVAGHTNYASLNDPDSPGFIGYRKQFLQMDGIFGSADTVKWIVKNYTRMFTPPIKVSFRAIGRNKLKALDVVTFQPLGSREKQPLIISSIKSEVDASKNTWYQDFECLWLFPRQDIEWGTTNEIGLGADGSISGGIQGA